MASGKIGSDGLMTAFFDAGSCTALLEGEGAVSAAYGMAGGQGVYVVCQKGVAMGVEDISSCRRIQRLASKTGCPVVTFYDSPGLKLESGLGTLDAARRLTGSTAKLSGVVPQIAVVTGVCGATSSMAAASADLCIMAKEGRLFLTPPFLSAAAGEKKENAGGADSAVKAGVASAVADSAEDAARLAARLVALLPRNNLAEVPCFEYEHSGAAFPAAYSAQSAIDALADSQSAVELFAGFGSGVTTALATVEGRTAGILATGGQDVCMGYECAAKAARFARLCDAYSIPLVTVLNSGGFCVSSESDEAGTIREAARLASTFADATCAKVAVLSGKTYGPLYAAMGSADLTIAMQGSVTAPVAATAAVSVLYKEELQESNKPVEAATAEAAKLYEEEVVSAKALLKAGLADFVADGATVRGQVAAALDILATKRAQRMPKKHGNMPL